MSVEHHQAIIVTARMLSKPIMDAGILPLEDVHSAAIRIFLPLLERRDATVEPMLRGSVNGFGTFVIAPSGSWFGYGEDDNWTRCARKFVAYLDGLREPNGRSPVSWIHVRYGTERSSEILSSSGPDIGPVEVFHQAIRVGTADDFDEPGWYWRPKNFDSHARGPFENVDAARADAEAESRRVERGM